MEVQMEGQQSLITAKETAKRLGISRPTLSRLVRKGRIGVYRVGGRTMFDEDVLDAFKRSVYVEPSGEVKPEGSEK